MGAEAGCNVSRARDVTSGHVEDKEKFGQELDQRETEESAKKICQRDDKEIRKLKKLDPWMFWLRGREGKFTSEPWRSSRKGFTEKRWTDRDEEEKAKGFKSINWNWEFQLRIQEGELELYPLIEPAKERRSFMRWRRRREEAKRRRWAKGRRRCREEVNDTKRKETTQHKETCWACVL